MNENNLWDTLKMLERFRQLKHKGFLVEEGAKRATMTSLGCGDKISMYVLLDKESGEILDACFSALSGVTCAVVADLLLDRVLENNLSVEAVKAVNIDRFLEEIGMQLTPHKKRSAKLPLDALKKALEK
jgi:NifU-like protein involved in Fe-S cluster formation